MPAAFRFRRYLLLAQYYHLLIGSCSEQATGERRSYGLSLGYSVGVTGMVLQNIWWEYEYGGKNPEFLRTIYPIFRDGAVFYKNFINSCERLSDGKVKFGPSVSPEHFGFSNDLSKNWNDIHALAYARFTIESAIKGAVSLDVDHELVKEFNNALQILPDYPTHGEDEIGWQLLWRELNLPCAIFLYRQSQYFLLSR